MDINTLKGDKYHLNNAFSNTTSRFKNEIYSKNNIKNIINEYLTDDYIISNYKQKNYKNIRECIYSSCENGNYEVFDYIMNKLNYIYYDDMKNAFIDLKLITYDIKYNSELAYSLKEKAFYGMNKDIIRRLKTICNIPEYNFSIENNIIIKSCQTGNVEYINFIMDIKRDHHTINTIIEVCDKYKHPLHIAYDNDNLHIIKYLEELGVNINLRNYNGNTLLHHAVWRNDIELVKYLIEDKGAIIINNNEGYTPLHLACTNDKYIEIFKYFTERHNNIGDFIYIAIKHDDNIEIVKYLIEDKGADMNIKNNKGETLLHMACRRNKIELVKYLIDKGADLNIINGRGETPLHYSSQYNNNTEIVQYLLYKGAYINILNYYHYTPLHTALHSLNRGVAMYLVDKGAGLNIKDKSGQTPLHIACSLYKNDKKLLKHLIDKGGDMNIKDMTGNTPHGYV